jgi:hypothetical protein
MLIGGYGLGVALAAAQILPTLDLARLSWERHSASTGYQDVWSLRPQQFLVQLLPDLYGRNGQDTYWGLAHYWEECSYVGALALALAGVGLCTRHRMARFYGGLAVLSVWLAMGTRGMAFSILRQLPAFGTMRLPCRYMFLFDLSTAVLAGIGADWLSRLQRPDERARAGWLHGLAAGALGVAALWLFVGWLGLPDLLHGVRSRLAQGAHFHTITNVAPLLSRYTRQLSEDVALLLGGLALAMALLWAAAHYRRLRRAIPTLAFVGVVATLFLFGSGYHTVIPSRWVADRPFTVDAIRATARSGPFRVLAWDSSTLHSDVAVHRGWWPTDERGYRQYIAALPGNYNLVWGLSGVRQEEWSALPLPYTRQLTSGILANGERGGFTYLAPYLRWLNTGFVISRQPLHDPSLTLVAADRTHLYRTLDPGCRVWIVHRAVAAPSDARLLQRLISDPEGLMESVALSSDGRRQTVDASEVPSRPLGTALGPAGATVYRLPSTVSESARIVIRSPTRVTVAAVAARAGYLVLGESWAPGWQAWVDGQPTPVLRANYVHRAVALSAGRHRVEFRYLPSAFQLGLYVSVTAIAVLLALATARLGGPA